MIRPGDLVFYRVTPQSGWLARLIAALSIIFRQGSGPINYSHVAIAEDAGSLLEAWWPRSRRRAIDLGNTLLEVWRISEASEAAAREAAAFARRNLGQWYNPWELLSGLFRMKHASICTTFVVRAWKSVGYDLAVDSGSVIAPNELMGANMLVRVSDV